MSTATALETAFRFILGGGFFGVAIAAKPHDWTSGVIAFVGVGLVLRAWQLMPRKT